MLLLACFAVASSRNHTHSFAPGVTPRHHHHRHHGSPVRHARLGWSDQCLTRTCDAHKPLLSPVTPLDGAVAVLVFAVAGLAMVGGIGGGGIFVPVLTLLLRFPPAVAAALSQSCIFGAALGALLFNAFAHHPLDRSRPLIDIPVTATLAPTEIAGALVGTQANRMLPPVVILGAMLLLLSATAVHTVRMGLRMRAAERARDSDGCETAGLLLRHPGSGPAGNAVPAGPRGVGINVVVPGAPAPPPDAGAPARPAAPSSDRAATTTAHESGPGRGGRWAAAGRLVLAWVSVLLLLLLRGRHDAPSIIGATECSTAYWALTAAALAGLLCTSASAASALSQAKAGAECGVEWTGRATVSALGQTLVAGIVAGMMGVGGGILLGPLMLRMGFLPQVSTATTATMILLTASSATAAFVLAERSPPDYSIALGLASFAGAYAGKRCFAAMLGGRNSPIVLLLGALIGASVVGVDASGALEVRSEVDRAARTGTAFNGLALLLMRPPCAQS